MSLIIDDDQRKPAAPSSSEPELMAASTLRGDRVVNAEGERIGKIIDVMLDVQAGRIAYAVLSFFEMTDSDDKLFVVPWNALTLDEEEQDFILGVDRDQLEHAPGIDKNTWPMHAQQACRLDSVKFFATHRIE